MTLAIYEQTSPAVYAAFSSGGTFTNPVTTKHHGRDGDVEEVQLYVRSNNANTYTNIEVVAYTTDSADDIGTGSNPGATGWGVKMMADPGHEPTEDEWTATDYGANVDITDISSSSTYIPFWVRIESPAAIRVTNKNNISLRLDYTDTP